MRSFHLRLGSFEEDGANKSCCNFFIVLSVLIQARCAAGTASTLEGLHTAHIVPVSKIFSLIRWRWFSYPRRQRAGRGCADLGVPGPAARARAAPGWHTSSASSRRNSRSTIYLSRQLHRSYGLCICYRLAIFCLCIQLLGFVGSCRICLLPVQGRKAPATTTTTAMREVPFDWRWLLNNSDCQQRRPRYHGHRPCCRTSMALVTPRTLRR